MKERGVSKLEKDNSYLIILSLDYDSDPSYGKVAAKVANTDRFDKMFFAEFCKAFPKETTTEIDLDNHNSKNETMIIRGGYELVSSKERALLLFSDYLINGIIDNITRHRRNSTRNKDECQIVIDQSFGERHVNETVQFYKDAIKKVPSRSWMINYFGKPTLITAGVNNKIKNHDPLLHCEKIISQASSFR